MSWKRDFIGVLGLLAVIFGPGAAIVIGFDYCNNLFEEKEALIKRAEVITY